MLNSENFVILEILYVLKNKGLTNNIGMVVSNTIGQWTNLVPLLFVEKLINHKKIITTELGKRSEEAVY